MALPSTQTVFVVDDSPEMRRTLCGFLRAAGLNVQDFSSADTFLSVYKPEMGGCLVLDIQLPGMSGLDLQEFLSRNGISLPIIIVSGQAMVKDAVRAMKLGSFEFVEKPFEPKFLLARVKEALNHDRESRKIAAKRDVYRERYNKLSERERQILSLVISGKGSKEIASAMSLTVSTVDNHRANLMKKLKAGTSAELATIALTVDPSLAFPKID